MVVLPPLRLSASFIDYPYLTTLGAYQAAAALADEGFDVSVLDAFADDASDLWRDGGLAWLGLPREPFLERIRGLQADLVVVGGSSFLVGRPGRAWLSELIAELRDAGSWFLALADMHTGGMHYIDYDGDKLLGENPGLDLLVRFEGERLLGRLARSIASGERPARGIWEEHEPFSLGDLNAPAYEKMEAEAYFRFLSRVLGSGWRPGPFPPDPGRSLPLVTSRGCPFGCLFCSRNPGLEGDRRTIRFVPWPRVEGWIRGWHASLGLERLLVLDEVANLEQERFDSLLGLLEELDLEVEFPNGLRADRLQEEQVRRLGERTSGLKVSLESASPRVQGEVLGKNLDPASVERVAGWCQRHDIPLQVHGLVGIPGERPDEIVQTLKMAVQLREEFDARPLIQFATPLPGTEMDKICRQRGYLGDEVDDLHACFQGRCLVRTGDFDPDFVERAMRAFRARIGPADGRKAIVNLTYRCNNHCVFCAVGDRPARDADRDAVVSALRRYRLAGFGLLDIDGGEPTLHPDLFDIISEGRRLGYERITLVTNARRMSYAAYAGRVARTGLDEVLISLHASDAGLQGRITGVAESFEQTLQGIQNLLRAMEDPGRVAVNTTIVAENLSSLKALGELLERTGIRRWNLQVVTPFGRARQDQVPDEEALRTALQTLLARAPDTMHIQVINCPPCLLAGHEDKAAVDFGKASRDMVFVGEQGENLQGFLSTRRRQDERCRACAEAVRCPGFYRFDPP